MSKTAKMVFPAIAKKTDLYTYVAVGWVDKLAYVRGKHLTYDDVGNLLTYNGKTHTWGEGRQLATFENGSVSAAYKYDENGLRTQKTVGNKTYSYTWANEKLVGSTDGTNALRFIYGSGSAPVGFTLNNTAVYLYLKNLQGDIVGIVDENGTTVVKYIYDAWGKPTSVTGTMASTIGEINPLRYRGYYYDSESGYYYVQTRYYDPEICRYINAADGGDAVPQAKAPAKYAHANRFLFNANNPQTYSMVPITPDVSGTGSSSNITYETSFDSSYISRLIKVLVFGYTLTYYEDAFIIVCDANSKKGIIQIDLEKTGECENTLSDIIYEFSDCMGEDVFLAMAVYATKSFEEKFPDRYSAVIETDTTSQREFLFSDECVANEIKQHVLGYWRSVGKDAPLTVTVAGMYVYTWIYSEYGSLYTRCKMIDIAEQDVISDSNRIAFDYFNGIRDCYFGKPADPFYYYNEGRKSTPRADWLVNKIPV